MSMIMTPEMIREELKDRTLSAIARATGLGYQTLRNVYQGIREPRFKTILILSDYLKREARRDNQ